ncbi:hypothetical protein BDV96DRAFT_322013 [Lophiotrema nucula]|uniref:Uncharacterized protein n=1 Tax=Lophiotrema nucula TaxID=690887 RepID=A0A6A5ZN46_9PLEO|nr:hypothetical protein BDV96DRAFT_322013 [Lophiotrema nucula]
MVRKATRESPGVFGTTDIVWLCSTRDRRWETRRVEGVQSKDSKGSRRKHPAAKRTICLITIACSAHASTISYHPSCFTIPSPAHPSPLLAKTSYISFSVVAASFSVPYDWPARIITCSHGAHGPAVRQPNPL